MKHLMVDLATLLVSSCSIYVSLSFLGVCGSSVKDIGVHSKRVPAFVLPDRCLQARGLDPTVERGFLQGGAADTRSKMRPDMMTVEMTTAEQQQYLHHDDNSGSRLTPLFQ